jgi:hypothetical protein
MFAHVDRCPSERASSVSVFKFALADLCAGVVAFEEPHEAVERRPSTRPARRPAGGLVGVSLDRQADGLGRTYLQA